MRIPVPGEGPRFRNAMRAKKSKARAGARDRIARKPNNQPRARLISPV
jgi:hypothetical protein